MLQVPQESKLSKPKAIISDKEVEPFQYVFSIGRRNSFGKICSENESCSRGDTEQSEYPAVSQRMLTNNKIIIIIQSFPSHAVLYNDRHYEGILANPKFSN